MKKNSITEFELEEKDSKLRLKRGLNGGSVVVPQVDDSVPMISLPAASAPMLAPAPAAAPVVNTGEIDIKSPMIGTFYRSPSPEAGSYCETGTEVNPDSVSYTHLTLPTIYSV